MKTVIYAVLYISAVVACTAAIKANAQTTATTIGGSTFINTPGRPVVICTRIGSTVFCN